MITAEGVPMPVRKTRGSCGYDVCAPCRLVLNKDWQTVDLGIQMEIGDIPRFKFGLLVPRSSMGSKYGLRLRNTVGIIDADYTMDTIKATLSVDCGEAVFEKGDRILQLIILDFGTIAGEETPIADRTGGMGSTGA